MIPLAIGAGISLAVGKDTVDRAAWLIVGAAFAVIMTATVRLRVVIDGDRLLMRNTIWWKTIALDALTEVKAHDGGRSGPGIRLEDRKHHHCWIRVEVLRQEERQQLYTELERRLAAGCVRLTGDLERSLLFKQPQWFKRSR
ncbi:hypothetical protein [Kitasatospora sp. MBT63]|uniref:hypothetical protein n=1 Tax=Kitasatospora sp. MBT63 TaxID=1444768 RepID=UPI00053A2974|nr:hypothetical protein [Kitasatospora sp. MBT63]